MKKALFSMLFLAAAGFSFYQCQKDTPVQNGLSVTATQEQPEDRGGPACVVTVSSDVGGIVCGTSTGTGSCVSCGGINNRGAASFAANVPYSFTSSGVTLTLLFTITNNSGNTGKFTLTTASGSYDFSLNAGACQDFTLDACNIVPL